MRLDIDILDISRTVFMEASGEPYQGKLGVAYVIVNRCKQARPPKSVQDVVFRSYQFSCWNTDSPTRMNLDEYGSATWFDSVKASAAAYFELSDDPTYGATMYLNPAVASPAWDWSKLEQTATIGNHVFYREI